MLTTIDDFDQRLARIRAFLSEKVKGLEPPFPQIALFFSVSDGNARARVVGATDNSLEGAWEQGISALRAMMKARNLEGRWIRVDWVENVHKGSWRDLRAMLVQVKRNYFRYGLALDKDLRFAFTEQELNANAMLYGGNSIFHAVVNEKNFSLYARSKFEPLPAGAFDDDREVYLLSTRGVFCEEGDDLVELNGAGLDAGRRRIEQLGETDVLSLIRSGSDYLSRQVNEDGSFVYGYHPCFDRRIAAYNTLRHASTTYSMIEAWEVTEDSTLKGAIERSLAYLADNLIRQVELANGTQAAFLVDVGDEIKLGGNAVAVLALAKYSKVTGNRTYLPLAEKLAHGIRFMQDTANGSFTHVLNYPDLSVKQRFRTIYYEGEAAFGLMRLYEITNDPRLLDTVEKAFEHFIANDHWKHHDHWLSYCVNELTRYRPQERYYRFGIRNFAGYLDFVHDRITTFPTLLELMMAAERMLTRLLERPEYHHLLDEVDLDKFYRALDKRAHYLLNGHFWPEIAMYYRNPDRIAGSFFIRHHAFRVRIDDVEHYLSGFVAYKMFLQRGGRPERPAERTKPRNVDPASISFLMYPESPRGFIEVRMLAEKSASKGLKVFYVSYKNAQISNGTLNGYVFEAGRWQKTRFDIPAIIDNAPPRGRQEIDLFDRLSALTFMTCHKLGGKQKTANLLAAHPETRKWLISSDALSGEKLGGALDSEGKAIVKPFRSNRGRNIYLVEKTEDGTFAVRTDDDVEHMDAGGLKAYVDQRSNGNWMVQKYVASVDRDGRPFDIRVPMFRSAGGAWNAARIYVRLGAGNLTSNLATGGSKYDAVPFLSQLYGVDAAEKIVGTLDQAARRIAEVLQESYPFMIDALGCDFGIVDGKAYLFEVNSYPGMKGCLETATDLKSEYYAALSQAKTVVSKVPVTNTLDVLRLFTIPRIAQTARDPIAIEAATEANRLLLQTVMARGENDFSRSPFLRPGMGNPAYALIGSEARRRGYKSKILNNTHLEVRDEDGVVAVFSPNSPDLSCPPREVVANKELTKTILGQAGLPAPMGGSFSDYDTALKYMLNRDRPQVVKPIRGYGGIGVTTGVVTEAQFQKAWERASRGKRNIVVEDLCVGDELRLIVLGGETLAAVCRVPAYVIGDGVSTISQLVDIKNARRQKNPLMRIYPIRQFDHLENELGLGLDFVPGHGEFVRLSTVSNVGLGGEAVSMVDVLHPSFLELARRATEALPGATQLGLDVIAKDFGADAFADNAAIIEVNSDPAIGTPRFAAYGPPATEIAVKLLDFVEKANAARKSSAQAAKAIRKAASNYDVPAGGRPFPRNHSLQVRLLRDAATRRGLNVRRLSAHMTIVERGGERRLFWRGMSDGTSLAALRAGRDREWFWRRLRQAGIPTPECQIFSLDDFDQARSFAEKYEEPLSVMSETGARGERTVAVVSSSADFQDVWVAATSAGASRIAVEPRRSDNAYRLFVVENRLVAAARYVAAHVVGTGAGTILDLIGEKNASRRENPYHSSRPVISADFHAGIRKMGLQETSILPKGEVLRLQMVVGTGNGSEIIDETAYVHPDWAAVAVRARQAIFDPYHAGIDICAEDIGKAPQGQKWCVSAIKVDPAFGIHHFPTQGMARDVADAVIEGLFG